MKKGRAIIMLLFTSIIKINPFPQKKEQTPKCLLLPNLILFLALLLLINPKHLKSFNTSETYIALTKRCPEALNIADFYSCSNNNNLYAKTTFQNYPLLTSRFSLASFAASTITLRDAMVSSIPRVFKPQSGLIQNSFGSRT
jgi:hypothetical protein